MFEDVRDLYNATIIERGRRPQHMHRLEAFDATAQGDNPMCGDRVRVWVKFATDGAIAETGFDARGCEISKASADLMVEAVQGRQPADARALFAAFRTLAQTGQCPACAEALAPLLPLASVHEYPSRVKCATLAWQALVAALDQPAGTTGETSRE
ncbi:MAG: SUF system NifU family Fe-S cluster assembly protein [Acetobacteraceae bacterium SCN 69-10]|nr:SUF system NifU family Fe-S cluster assembly protein [Rhodospirillales bacterium]ODU55711.1 MAG: SUF system NifU family Fe-S cluster assembly protein [Acetobacteraceae bacterium SCN 69-10]OJY64957.1 MAG: SUF system NifU family Fe-S cluster assembly protein [Rhodospirillales bacterium 70-18]